jgi:hypothetical protein
MFGSKPLERVEGSFPKHFTIIVEQQLDWTLDGADRNGSGTLFEPPDHLIQLVALDAMLCGEQDAEAGVGRKGQWLHGT